MQEKFFNQLFINGAWISTTKTIDVINSVNQNLVTAIAHAETQHIDEAIQSAHVAFSGWKNTAVQQRCDVLLRWYDLIQEHKQHVVKLINMENGKPIIDATAEIDYALDFIPWAIEQAKHIYGYSHNHPSQANIEMKTYYEPVGVVGAITPWNFPAAMVIRKVSAPLAVGCTIILKPSELTPLTAFYLAHLLELAGLPKGVLNVITGDPQQIGDKLCASSIIRKLTFTGSTRVGKILYAACANTMKKLSLELGGNAPFIIFADSNLDEAIKGLMLCKFRNSGQACTSVNRVLVEQSIYNEVAQRLKVEVAKVKVGPLINQASKIKVQHHITDAVSNGATLYFGGEDLSGNFIQPTILTQMNEKCLVNHEETFGPLLSLFSFATEDEAMRMANSTPFGLAAYVYSTNVQRIRRVTAQIEAGMIAINNPFVSYSTVDFGGVKESGLGREGGKSGIYEFMHLKATVQQF